MIVSCRLVELCKNFSLAFEFYASFSRSHFFWFPIFFFISDFFLLFFFFFLFQLAVLRFSLDL